MYHIGAPQGQIQLRRTKKIGDNHGARVRTVALPQPPIEPSDPSATGIPGVDEGKQITFADRDLDFGGAGDHCASLIGESEKLQRIRFQQAIEVDSQVGVGLHGAAKAALEGAAANRFADSGRAGRDPDPAPRQLATKIGDSFVLRREDETDHFCGRPRHPGNDAGP
jgi:hypothetical protein